MDYESIQKLENLWILKWVKGVAPKRGEVNYTTWNYLASILYLTKPMQDFNINMHYYFDKCCYIYHKRVASFVSIISTNLAS
jgi:hypothetical protein